MITVAIMNVATVAIPVRPSNRKEKGEKVKLDQVVALIVLFMLPAAVFEAIRESGMTLGQLLSISAAGLMFSWIGVAVLIILFVTVRWWFTRSL